MAGCYENRAKSRTGGNGYSPLNWPWPFLRWFMVAIVVAALGLAKLIGKQPCARCRWRRELMNRIGWWPVIVAVGVGVAVAVRWLAF